MGLRPTCMCGHYSQGGRPVKESQSRRTTAHARAIAQVEIIEAHVMEKRAERDAQAENYSARPTTLEEAEGRGIEWARKGHIEEAAMLSQIDQIRAERRDLSQRH